MVDSSIFSNVYALECAKALFNKYLYETLAFHFTGISISVGFVLLALVPSFSRR
jgi:hypothetical protein